MNPFITNSLFKKKPVMSEMSEIIQPKRECCYMAYQSACTYNTIQKISFLLYERDDYGYYGIRILLPSNLMRLDAIFCSRYIPNYIIKCTKG